MSISNTFEKLEQLRFENRVSEHETLKFESGGLTTVLRLIRSRIQTKHNYHLREDKHEQLRKAEEARPGGIQCCGREWCTISTCGPLQFCHLSDVSAVLYFVVGLISCCSFTGCCHEGKVDRLRKTQTMHI